MWCSDDEYLWQMMMKEQEERRKAMETARPVGTVMWSIQYKDGSDYGVKYKTEEEARAYIQDKRLTYRREVWNGTEWEA
jgi:hypothetical protein